jgi:hypothetical protein
MAARKKKAPRSRALAKTTAPRKKAAPAAKKKAPAAAKKKAAAPKPSTAPLASRLQFKEHKALVLVNAPTEAKVALKGALPGVTVGGTNVKTCDAVMAFLPSMKDVLALAPPLLFDVNENALVWLAYPKGSTAAGHDVNRDTLSRALEPTGWTPVRQVALDDTWSALRFRPADKVR